MKSHPTNQVHVRDRFIFGSANVSMTITLILMFSVFESRIHPYLLDKICILAGHQNS
jgi:hypothetical protein